jgi:prepilin-type N-terminal cleavage/methylation domain-containing protein
MMKMFSTQSAKGFVLFELLIVMTILAGSVTTLHNIYANLVAKQIKLQKAHARLLEFANQSEIQIAQEQLKKASK